MFLSMVGVGHDVKLARPIQGAVFVIILNDLTYTVSRIRHLTTLKDMLVHHQSLNLYFTTYTANTKSSSYTKTSSLSP